jgi:hypothetical protein
MRLPLVGFANGKIEYNSSPLFYQAVQTIVEVEERPLHLAIADIEKVKAA